MVDYKSKDTKKLYIQLAIYILIFALAMLFLFVKKTPIPRTDSGEIEIYEHYYRFLDTADSYDYEEYRFDTTEKTYTRTSRYISAVFGGAYEISDSTLTLKNDGIYGDRVFNIYNGGELLLERSSGERLWGSNLNYDFSITHDGDGDGTYESYCVYIDRSSGRPQYILAVYDRNRKIFEEKLNTFKSGSVEPLTFINRQGDVYVWSYLNGSGQDLCRIVNEKGTIKVIYLIYEAELY